MGTCPGLLWFVFCLSQCHVLLMDLVCVYDVFRRIATGPLADHAVTGSTMDGIGITMVGPYFTITFV